MVVPSSWCPARVGGGSGLKLLPPFPVDPADPPENSKNKVFFERVVTVGPDWRSRMMFFSDFFQIASRKTRTFEHVLAHVPALGFSLQN